MRREVDAFHVVDQPLACLLGRGLQVLEVLDAPVLHDHRHEDLVVVRLEVVHADVGDLACTGVEVGNPRTGHLEVADLALDRRHHRGRVDLERGTREVAVVEVVEVLVGGDAAHDRLAGRVVEQLSGVPMRDTCGDLLQRDVHDAVGDARRVGDDAP